MELSIEKILEIENKFAVEALKSVFLLNGVAAITMLTFIGTIAVSSTASPSIDVSTLSKPLFIFAIGTGLAVSAYGAAFLAAYNMAMLFRYGKKPRKKIKKKHIRQSKRLEFLSRLIAFILGASSWLCFFAGTTIAFFTFSGN